MSTASKIEGTPISGVKDVAEFFRQGYTVSPEGLTGVENEKLALNAKDNTPIVFAQAQAIYGALQKAGYAPVPDADGNLVGAKKDKMNWSLEPGLQMETAGSPHASLHSLAKEIDLFVQDGVTAAAQNNTRLVALGYQPLWKPADIPQRPGDRYVIMHAFNDRVKSPEGHGMMNSTATTQVSVSFNSEEDAQRKTRAAVNVQSVVSALFANSPFRDGGLDPNGLQSVRSDNNREIMGGRYGYALEAAFKPGAFFNNLADHFVNDMPMMGYYRSGKFIDAQGMMFADFMKNGQATTTDFVNHQKTIFPEVRSQPAPGVVEMRAADTVPQELVKGMAALYVGLMHDRGALDEVLALTRKMTPDDRKRLRHDVPYTGLQTKFNDKATVQDVDLQLLKIADTALRNRGILNAEGQDESVYLQPLWEIATSGKNWAQRLTEIFHVQGIHGAIRHMDYASNGGKGPSVLKVG